MKISFQQKTAVVTGGTGGIGMACAKTLLEADAQVCLVDISNDRLQEAVKELSAYGAVRGYAVDISTPDVIKTGIQAIVQDMGQIDVLIQTAGLLQSIPGLEVTEAQWDKMLSVNAKGSFFVMQEVVLQSMKEHGGSIINFASMAGIRGMNQAMAAAHYSASKGAVVAMTMQAAAEWGQYQVRVNAVAPGGVLTKAMQQMQFDKNTFASIPLGKLSRPQDIADAVVFLASDRAAMITGQTLVIDGGSSIVGY